MQSASQARQVPLPLIEAIAYVNTRWEWINTPAADGGVGPMHIRPSHIAQAASLSGHSSSEIAHDLTANVDAGAALLARLHTGASDLVSWRSAVISTQGDFVAVQIYDTLRSGASRTTSTGESITLAPQPIPPLSATGATAVSATSPDYPPAAWVPASSSNYSTANRPHDYPVDMIVIHDIEGSVGLAIQLFQDATYQASAHYIVSYQGQITQMVAEHDIAWHAGNWDYNTRAIGIEHEGFAWTPGLYTTAEYQASAQLAASICSRWGVPMDRQHVIGHAEVPDPNNPGQFGGVDHHTDPGPYWDWSYYMNQAQAYANALPSPPHMVLDAVAVNGLTTATVSWHPARSCHVPISGYTVVAQPGNIVMNLPASATSANFTGLQTGVKYTFTVTAINPDGQDTVASNPVTVGGCTNAGLSANLASPQATGTVIQLTATSSVCVNPQYEFWLKYPNGSTSLMQNFGPNTWSWDTTGYAAGSYVVSVWAIHAGGNPSTWESMAQLTYSLHLPPCASAALAPSNTSVPVGSTIGFTASATACPSPQYEYWVLYPSGTWNVLRLFSSSPGWTWDTSGLAPGIYTVHVWASQQGGPYWEAIGSATVTLTNTCITASVTPSSSTQPAGSTIAFTASSTGCLGPRYAFWVQDPSGNWSFMQGFGGPTWSWNTTGLAPGIYTVHVWANRQGNGWDAIGSATVTLTGCSSAALSPANPSQTAGTTVNFTASSSGCANPRYAFWVQYPNGSWYLMQGFGSAMWSWSTSGLSPGTYTMHVWVNTQGNGYDAFGSTTVTLTGCTSGSLSPANSTQAAGTTINLSAGSMGCSNPLYAFWVQYPNGSWYFVRNFGSPTFSWSTAGLAPGSYTVHVWVNTQGNGYDTFGSAAVNLT